MNCTGNITSICTDSGINTVGKSAWQKFYPKNEQVYYKNISAERAASMCMVITVVSFLGFWVENIFVAFTGGYMDNRNMVLPFLLGYGLAIMAIYLLFGTPDEPRFFGTDISSKNKVKDAFTFFFISFLCVCVGECILGTLVEKTCGIVWWNYSDIPLHFTKYTSIPTSLGFAFLITVFMKYFFVSLYNGFAKMDKKVLYALAVIFTVLLLGDYLFSTARMFNTHELMKIWRIEL